MSETSVERGEWPKHEGKVVYAMEPYVAKELASILSLEAWPVGAKKPDMGWLEDSKSLLEVAEAIGVVDPDE